MRFDSNPAATRLARRGLISLRDRAGEHIECLDGSLWITQEGDVRDMVLEAGEGFTLDRRGTAVVYALEDACLIVWPRASQKADRAGAQLHTAPARLGPAVAAPERSAT